MKNKSEDKELVAVYGTLKKGRSNSYLLSGCGCRFLGEGKTVNKFAMYASGIPFVTDKEQVSNIQVEVYQVSKLLLEGQLDSLEGHPEWYQRRKTEVEITNEKGEIELLNAWLYFFDNVNKNHAKLIESGKF